MTQRTARKLQSLQREADRLTQRHPIGTEVRYWLGAREGEGRLSRVRSAYGVLGGHTTVVWLEGVAGCVAASHVEAVKP